MRAGRGSAATRWGEESQAIQEVVQVYQRNPAFSQVELPASHHLHLTSPDLVIPHINLFCSRHGLLEVEQ